MFSNSKKRVVCALIILSVGAACGVDIFEAAEKGDAEEAARMLQENPEEIRRAKGDCKESPLHVAAKYGHVEVIRLLLKQGAEVNARDVNEATPLHKAASFDRHEVAQILMEHGAEVNVYNSSRETPLLKALRNCEMVVLLVQYGADVNVRWFDSAQLNTPLVQAIYLRKRDIVQFLICHGAMVFYELFNFRSLVLEKRLQRYFPDFDWRTEKAKFIKARIDYFMEQFGLPEVIAILILKIEGVVPSSESEGDGNGSECTA